MVPDISFGQNTQVALEIGGGIGIFGASLLERNVSTLTIAPKDAHDENQIQLALERSVPAMFSIFATYSYLSSEMVDLNACICWELAKKEGNIAIWRKPSNKSCYISLDPNIQPPMCDIDDDPDNVWYVIIFTSKSNIWIGVSHALVQEKNTTAKKLTIVIFSSLYIPIRVTRLPESESENGANVIWPMRLHNPPSRLQSIRMDSYMAKKDFSRGSQNIGMKFYVNAYRWKEFKSRSVMDMRAGLGGCESFDTYPRTYDLVHVAGLFSIEQGRIVRPSGHVYIHDKISVVSELEDLAAAVGWWCVVHNTFEGPHENVGILICEKLL
ncbi:LOW QUALITY PROTEIN: putative S-adenosyl-L-methionine-dependent methyltransferase [Dillenia turbinata]|uniref:Methyltransferase n=1 Tax=Dillenia turbinata TaxID=194707 RepID=A0AAN8VTQ0_9MAGN